MNAHKELALRMQAIATADDDAAAGADVRAAALLAISKPYPLEPETVEVARADRAPALGTYQPPAPYRVAKSRRSKVPTKPRATPSK